ncbi:MAG: calcium-binding protein [Rhodobacterales bacterium]|nr:calcium-binding protein [Rhodobacterales bacterium]
MLAGFLFLGILAASSLPDMMDLWRADTGDDGSDAESPDEAEPEQEVAEILSGPEPEPELSAAAPASEARDPAEGEDMFVDPEPGETAVEAFNPGVDSLTIVLPDEAQEFSAHDATDDQAAYLGYETAEGSVQIAFPGLDTVPVSDIFLRVYDAASPTLDADIALSQLIDDDVYDEDDTGGALTLIPVDPTLPDDPALPPQGEGTVLTPVTDDPLSEEAEALAELFLRDGASPVGLTGGASDIERLSDGADTLTLSDAGDPGNMRLDEAAPVLSGNAVAVVDLAAGDDVLTTGGGASYGFGGLGDDILTAGSGAAALFGGDGNDLLTGDPAGGRGYLHGGAGDDTVIGGSADAWLDGGEHGEAASGPGGDDRITGGAGDDTLRGGLGADLLVGGAGNDVIDHRGTDAERIIAERHEFAWHIDGAPDTLDGGAGNDTLSFDLGDLVIGGAGDDVMWLYADAAAPAAGMAEIADFTPGEDFLRISLNPQISAAGVVDIAVSEDGQDGLVQVDGVTVAILRGAPNLSLTDIYVETAPDVFPAG